MTTPVDGLVLRSLTIHTDQVKELQRILDGKKGRPAQTAANDKVWELNERTERALAHLATVFEACEEVGMDVDQDVDEKCDMTDDAEGGGGEGHGSGEDGHRDRKGGDGRFEVAKKDIVTWPRFLSKLKVK